MEQESLNPVRNLERRSLVLQTLLFECCPQNPILELTLKEFSERYGNEDDGKILEAYVEDLSKELIRMGYYN